MHLDARLVGLGGVDDLILAGKIRILNLRHRLIVLPLEDHVIAEGILL